MHNTYFSVEGVCVHYVFNCRVILLLEAIPQQEVRLVPTLHLLASLEHTLPLQEGLGTPLLEGQGFPLPEGQDFPLLEGLDFLLLEVPLEQDIPRPQVVGLDFQVSSIISF